MKISNAAQVSANISVIAKHSSSMGGPQREASAPKLRSFAPTGEAAPTTTGPPTKKVAASSRVVASIKRRNSATRIGFVCRTPGHLRNGAALPLGLSMAIPPSMKIL
jgi:hypothetical protein